MSDNRGGLGSRITGGLAALVAGIVTRKVMTKAWTRIVGKEPPDHPEDPQVALAEAVGWSATMGVAMATAKVLATRAAARRGLPKTDPGPGQAR